jgi:hypothetical protein
MLQFSRTLRIPQNYSQLVQNSLQRSQIFRRQLDRHERRQQFPDKRVRDLHTQHTSGNQTSLPLRSKKHSQFPYLRRQQIKYTSRCPTHQQHDNRRVLLQPTRKAIKRQSQADR